MWFNIGFLWLDGILLYGYVILKLATSDIFIHFCALSRTSLVAQTVKRLSTSRETWVRSLGREDPPEKEMTIHSSTIAWKIPWTEEPDGLQSMGSLRVGHE